MFVGGGRTVNQFQHGLGLATSEISRRELFAHSGIIRTGHIRSPKVRESILGLSMLEELLTKRRIPLEIRHHLGGGLLRRLPSFIQTPCIKARADEVKGNIGPLRS